MAKAIKLDSASDYKIEVIMQNIMGNIQEHYPKTIASKMIGAWSWRNESESIQLPIYVLPVFVKMENIGIKRQFNAGCTS
jgi:hypothetical protein